MGSVSGGESLISVVREWWERGWRVSVGRKERERERVGEGELGK